MALGVFAIRKPLKIKRRFLKGGYPSKYDFCTGRKFHFLGQALQVSAQNQSLGRVAPQVL